MILLNTITEDLKKAQIARDEVSVSTLRLLLSEAKNSEISLGHELSDDELISVIRKEVKKRNESAQAFKNGGREELAAKEEAEAKILENYLPAQMDDSQLEGIINEVISQTGASSMADMGKVIGIVLGKVGSSADGGRVSMMVKEKLNG